MATADGKQEVVVTDIRMRFTSMVMFMVKWAIASIPALIILFVLALVFGGITVGFFSSLRSNPFGKVAASGGLSSPLSAQGSSVRGADGPNAQNTPVATPRPKPEISLSSSCFSFSATSADVLDAAKRYAVRKDFHDLQCAKMLLDHVPQGDPLRSEAARLQDQYTLAQKRAALETERQAEEKRAAEAKRLGAFYGNLYGSLYNVTARAVGPHQQALLVTSPVMGKLVRYDLSTTENCANWLAMGFTKVEGQNSTGGDSWELCPHK